MSHGSTHPHLLRADMLFTPVISSFSHNMANFASDMRFELVDIGQQNSRKTED
jgi:hypothetical protein